MTISSQAFAGLMSIGGKTLSAASAGDAAALSSLAGASVSQALSSSSSRSATSRRNVLEAMKSRADPLLNFNWYIDMPTVQPFGKTGRSVSLGWEFVEEATLPLIEFEQVSNYQAGKMVHFPKNYSIGTLGLKFYEDSKATSTNYLQTWQQAMFDPDTGLQNYPTKFKKSIIIYILDVANLTAMAVKYTGCWPTRLDPVALASSQSERVIVGAEISVDSVSVDIGKFSTSQIPSLMSSIGQSVSNSVPNLPSVVSSVFS